MDEDKFDNMVEFLAFVMAELFDGAMITTKLSKPTITHAEDSSGRPLLPHLHSLSCLPECLGRMKVTGCGHCVGGKAGRFRRFVMEM